MPTEPLLSAVPPLDAKSFMRTRSQRLAGTSFKYLILFLFLSVFLSVAGCGGSSSGSDQARATVLVYIMGTDLEESEGQATGNLAEMMRVGSGNDVNIVVETGGARKEGWTTVKRQIVLPGRMEELTDLGAQPMNDPDNLRKFIEWGVKAYPADSYHLVLWDHGGGPMVGVGGDTNYEPNRPISMPQLVETLEGAKQTTGVTFDLIGFDTCLMASVEVAYMLSPFGRYMVASQDVSYGWDWTAYLDHLVNDAGSTAVSAGTVIVDSYVAKMARYNLHSTTQSLVDLGRTSTLIQYVADMSAAITDTLGVGDDARHFELWSDLAYVRRSTHDYHTSWFYPGQWYDLVDLGDLITKPALMQLGVTDEHVAKIQSALDEAVVHSAYGRNLWQASGVTLYLPMVSVRPDSPLSYALYAPLPLPDSMRSLVARYAELALSPELPSPLVEKIEYSGTTAYATVQNPRFAAVQFANLWDISDPANPVHYAVKPLDADPPTGSEDDYQIAANSYDGWFLLPGADGQQHLVSVLPDDMPRFAADQARFTVPVHMPGEEPGDLGKNGQLMVNYTEDAQNGTKSYHIIGYLMETESSPAASRPNAESLRQGMVFYPLVLVDGEWKPDLTRKIVSFDAANVDTPSDEGWQLIPTSSAGFCGSSCGFSFGTIDYQGKLTL